MGTQALVDLINCAKAKGTDPITLLKNPAFPIKDKVKTFTKGRPGLLSRKANFRGFRPYAFSSSRGSRSKYSKSREFGQVSQKARGYSKSASNKRRGKKSSSKSSYN